MGHGISNSKVLAECDLKAGTVMFLRSPRKADGTRGHHPDNSYAVWRNPLRDARRKLGGMSGRQWTLFRKYGQKAWRQMQRETTMGGTIEADAAR